MKKIIRIIAGDIASENFSRGGELITFGLIAPAVLVIATILASL